MTTLARVWATGSLAIALGAPPVATTAQMPAPPPATPSASPAPTPTMSPTPPPAVTLNGVLLGMETFNANVNARGNHANVNARGNLANGGGADQPTRFNVSSAFLTIARNTGFFRYGGSADVYSIPVVGLSGSKTFQAGANVNTYGPLPSAYIGLNLSDFYP
jgi:hypothetical protein